MTGTIPYQHEGLPLFPNWSESVRDTIEYKTDITITRKGVEQRRSIRAMPRVTTEFSVLQMPQNSDIVPGLAATRVGAALLMPHPCFGLTILGVTPEFLTYRIAALPRWYRQPQAERSYVLLSNRDRSRWEVARFSVAWGAQNVYVEHMPTYSFGPGDRIYRALPGRLTDTTFAYRGNVVHSGRVRFEVEPGAGVYNELRTESESNGGPGSLIDDRETFPFTANWGQEVSLVAPTNRESQDYGYGLRNYTVIGFEGRPNFRFTITTKTRAETEALIAFFMRHRGQCRAFNFCHPVNELKPIADLQFGSAAINVRGPDWLRPYGSGGPDFVIDRIYKKLRVRLKSGETYDRDVTAISGINPYSTGASTSYYDAEITLSETWERTITTDEIESVAWVTLARFFSDSLNVDWLTSDVATATVTIAIVVR